ncbi:ShlB/FhaC/HecB family hemolysin secretion/activation protein [Gloeocapsa sp. PCC 73106]|uniref:ShlB/FhaC/HecB family hemolysin secretion/activation protein n=1 Tax=Gloeocapsa sp. PCC 73106 TaxID=102232 RepID=UPI0002AB9CC5|nr:ShlB/FhaC/HecB family hemolysin secretion/activation protein [Gloeocapsa sp. PCC 73106]ELR97429.1 hemolysin activation/secretion protein [Gloeocapsa sp. PCC 73106]
MVLFILLRMMSVHHPLLKAIAWLLLLSWKTPVNAQVVPRPITPVPQFPPEVEVLPPLEEIFPPTEEVTPREVPTIPEIPTKIIIRQFVVVGSTVFTPRELAEVLEKYTNRPIAFAELLEAQTAVTQLYLNRGYLTSGAFIPPQSLQEGVVVMEVIEGKVETITITGLKRLNPEYIRSRLALATAGPLNQNELLKALQLLQLNPLIENLAAELTPGTDPNLSILKVRIEEAAAFSLELGLDNQRSPSVGSVRRLLTLNHRNLLGFGDNFRLRYYNTDGSNAIDELSYLFPINPYDGLVGFRFSYSDSDLIQEPLAQLDIDSQSHTYEFVYRQPVFKNTTEELAIGFNLAVENSNLTVPVLPTRSLQSEADITVFRFFQEYFIRDQRQVFAVFSQLNFAVNSSTVDLNGAETDNQFLLWRGQVQYLRNLNSFITFLSKVEMQFADTAIPSLEQFALGGVYRGRGYPENAILGDNGVFGSLELRFSIWTIPEINFNLQLVSFLDVGHVWNNADFSPETNTLSSAGVGIRLTAYERLNVSFEWGIPFVDFTTIGDSLQEQGLYFSIQYQILKF